MKENYSEEAITHALFKSDVDTLEKAWTLNKSELVMSEASVHKDMLE